MKPVCLILLLLLLLLPTAASPDDSIQIFVGPGKAITITIPNMDKDSLLDLVSTFFAQKKPEMRNEIRKKFAESSELTLVLTTKKGTK